MLRKLSRRAMKSLSGIGLSRCSKNCYLPTRSRLVSRIQMAGGFDPCESLQTRFSPGLRRTGLSAIVRPLAKGFGLRGRKREGEKRLRDERLRSEAIQKARTPDAK